MFAQNTLCKFLIAQGMAFFLMASAWAGGTDANASANASAHAYMTGGDTTLSTGPMIANPTQVQGDTNVSGDKNRAYALGMASGTIADCMAHVGLAVLSWPKRNKFCERIDFTAWAENPARHTPNSVKIRCSSKIAVEIFGDRAACEEAFVTVEPEDAHQAEIDALSTNLVEIRTKLVDVMATVASLQAEKEKALTRVARAEKVAQRAAAAPQNDAFEQRRRAAKEILEGKQ